MTSKDVFNATFRNKLEGKECDNGGFFDLPKAISCRDPHHEPPKHMVIPQGKGFRHVCPSCGKVTTIIPLQISL